MTSEQIRQYLLSQNADDQWKAIMSILDQAAEAEIGYVCGAGLTPDERSHSAGRLDAVLSTKKLLGDAKEDAIKTL